MKISLCLCLFTLLAIGHAEDTSSQEEGSLGDIPTLAEEYLGYIKDGGQIDKEFDAGQEAAPETKEQKVPGISASDSLLRGFRKEFENLEDSEATQKLAKTLKDIDTDKDNYISHDELLEWVIQQGEKVSGEEDASDLGMVEIDANKDGKLTWKEILDDLNSSKGSGQAPLTKKEEENEKMKFDYADADKDGYLNEDEFRRFGMPEFFRSMTKFMIKSFMLDFDSDTDGQVTRDEFAQNTGVTPNEIAGAKERFDNVDTNKDGVLKGDEIKGVALEYGVEALGKQETVALMAQLDVNQDGKLAIEEVMQNHAVLTTAPSEEQDKEFSTDYEEEEGEGGDQGRSSPDEQGEEQEEPEEPEEVQAEEEEDGEEPAEEEGKTDSESPAKDEL